MKRKIIPFLLVLALMFALCISASAANYTCRRTCTVQNGRIICKTYCYVTTCRNARPVCTTCPVTPNVKTPVPQKVEEQTPAQNAEAAVPADTVGDFEKQVAELVNAERAKYGLSALTLRTDLCDGARAKSQDMHDQGYFAHQSPTYGTPFEMMKSRGIAYSYAGENIARGYPDPESVVNAWMNSEGHRANILSASFTAIGVGYVASGNYWTQWFVG